MKYVKTIKGDNAAMKFEELRLGNYRTLNEWNSPDKSEFTTTLISPHGQYIVHYTNRFASPTDDKGIQTLKLWEVHP